MRIRSFAVAAAAAALLTGATARSARAAASCHEECAAAFGVWFEAPREGLFGEYDEMYWLTGCSGSPDGRDIY
jgi:hypothetical protein